jgi:phage terminase small subunit
MPAQKKPPPLPPDGAFMSLRIRGRRFVQAYVETGGVGAEAMRRIGFKGLRPDHAAWKMRLRPEIRAAIAEYDAFMTQEIMARRYQTLRQLEFIANFDHRRLYDKKGQLLEVNEWPDDVAAAVASIEIEELFEGKGGEREHIGRLKKFRAWPKVEALKMLAQIQKLIIERRELTGKDGEPLPTGPVYVIARQEAEEIAQALDEKV